MIKNNKLRKNFYLVTAICRRYSQVSVRFVLVMLILGTLTALLMPTYSAMACSPTPTPQGFKGPSITDYTNQAHLVAEGTIKSVMHQVASPNSPFTTDEATIEVNQYLKGSGTNSLNVGGFGENTLCLIEAHVGDHKLFFVDIDSQGLAWIRTVYSVNANTVNQILVAAQPAAQVTEITIPKSIVWPMLAVVIVVILVIGVISIRRLRIKKDS